MTNTLANSVLIDARRVLGCGDNSCLLFFKDRVKVKDGMMKTMDNKQGQHHYLSYHQPETNVFYVDYKMY
jgi:hypothetical protein